MASTIGGRAALALTAIVLMGFFIAGPAVAQTATPSPDFQTTQDQLTDLWYELSPLFILLSLVVSLMSIMGSIYGGRLDVFVMIQRFISYNISMVNFIILTARGIIMIFSLTAQAAAPLIQSGIDLVKMGLAAIAALIWAAI